MRSRWRRCGPAQHARRAAARPSCRPRGSVADRVAGDVEPAAAAVHVTPALEMDALGIAAHEQVVGPLRVGQRSRLLRARDVRLAAAAEFGLVALAAPGTGIRSMAASRRRILDAVRVIGYQSGRGSGRACTDTLRAARPLARGPSQAVVLPVAEAHHRGPATLPLDDCAKSASTLLRLHSLLVDRH